METKLYWTDPPEVFLKEVEKYISFGYDNKLIMAIPLTLDKIGYDAFFSIFKCKRCGRCCLSMPETCPEDMQGISFTDLELSLVKKDLPANWESHTTKTLRGYRMKFPCLFYDKATGCRIYDRRPKPCQDFPLTSHPTDKKSLYVNAFCPGGAAASVMVFKLWYNKMNRRTIL